MTDTAQPTTIALGGYVYDVAKLPVELGLPVATRLANMLAPIIQALPDKGFDPAQLALGPLAGQFLAALDGDRLLAIAKPLAQGTTVTGPTGAVQNLGPVFGVHFAGRYDVLMGWLLHAIKVNFGTFSQGAVMGQLLAMFQGKAVGASVSQSPSAPENSGPSGG